MFRSLRNLRSGEQRLRSTSEVAPHRSRPLNGTPVLGLPSKITAVISLAVSLRLGYIFLFGTQLLALAGLYSLGLSRVSVPGFVTKLVKRFNLFLIFFVPIHYSAFLAMKIYPEVDMFVHSTCKDTTRVYHDDQYVQSYGKYAKPYQSMLKSLKWNDDDRRPIYFFGTHHKTGTYLAMKIFSSLCATFQLCCVYEVSKSKEEHSVAALRDFCPDVFGHYSWHWLPQELIQVLEEKGRPYKFVHFWRDPRRKIISGYQYHGDGAEGWCNRPWQPFDQTCTTDPEQKCNSLDPIGTQSCHVINRLQMSDLWPRSDALALGSNHPTVKLGDQLICNYLAKLKRRPGANGALNAHSIPLSEMFRHHLNLTEGLRAEAALEFYEDLNMALIYNHTADDPHSLNVELDELVGNYQGTVLRILQHLDLHQGNPTVLKELFEQMRFYDLKSSKVYRWVMETFYDHGGSTINKDKEKDAFHFDKAEATWFTYNDPVFLEAYNAIFELLGRGNSHS